MGYLRFGEVSVKRLIVHQVFKVQRLREDVSKSGSLVASCGMGLYLVGL